MTTTIDLDLPERITVLKHLAAGKPVDVTATITGHSASIILDLASRHGYPDRDKMSWAVDVLTKKHQDAAIDAIPTGDHRPTRAATPDPRTPPARPLAVSTAAAPVDDLRSLVDRGLAHPSKRVQAAAQRVLDHADKVRDLMADDDRKHAARRKAEAEKAKARAEVQRLEEQLAAAKAKLRSSNPTPDATKRPGNTLPKGEHPCRHDGCDKVYDTTQGRSLHERLKCTHRPTTDAAAAS